MRVLLAKSLAEAVESIVAQVLNQIREKPNSVIGLATGRTMEPVYELWVKGALAQGIDHSQCRFYMLDEYIGLEEGHPASFKHYIENRLCHPLKLRPEQLFYPAVAAPDLEIAAKFYEASIYEKGGIDLQLLGIGQNGHIGFNEPGSTKNSRTRVVDLAADTMQANQESFGKQAMPSKALSMGIGTILEARKLCMLVTGKSKAKAVKYLLNHHDDPTCPATYLKSHLHFNLVLDPEGASAINLKI
jgi:glucosamine-6-phosphate deaminase